MTWFNVEIAMSSSSAMLAPKSLPTYEIWMKLNIVLRNSKHVLLHLWYPVIHNERERRTGLTMSFDVVYSSSRPIYPLLPGLPNCPLIIKKALPCVWITVIFSIRSWADVYPIWIIYLTSKSKYIYISNVKMMALAFQLYMGFVLLQGTFMKSIQNATDHDISIA
jgi:hypothetical protein